MKRQLALIRFALGSAHRRSGRTLSLVAALALVTFSYASVLFLTEALRREFRMAAIALPDLTVQSVTGMGLGIVELHRGAIGDAAPLREMRRTLGRWSAAAWLVAMGCGVFPIARYWLQSGGATVFGKI